MVQLVPSQRSTRAPEETRPTAVQAFADEHDTSFSWPLAGPGAVWTDQLLPFHVTTSTPLEETLEKTPTATQWVADVQDTPRRIVEVAPGGLGTDWTVQLLPSHRTASATVASVPWNPTAVQALADEQDTEIRLPPATLGIELSDQVLPSQDWAIG